MNSPLAVDLGTTHTRISRREHVLIQRFPSAIAVKMASGEPIAIGKDALPMLGRTPAGVRACRPLQYSAVADYDLAVMMLHTFFKQAQALGFLQRPTVAVAIPQGLTEVEKRELEDVVRDAGARAVKRSRRAGRGTQRLGAPRLDDRRYRRRYDQGGRPLLRRCCQR